MSKRSVTKDQPLTAAYYVDFFLHGGRKWKNARIFEGKPLEITPKEAKP